MGAKVAIIGGGVAGASIALYLGELGLDVTLFEKGKSLVNGPPICHLHAGGNLYREISDEQCVTLLQQSIDLLRFLPFAVDYRPTVIAVPTDDEGKPEDLCHRLHLLQSEYQKFVEKDVANKVLGEVSEYFQTFSQEEVAALKERETLQNPQSLEEWMIPVAKNIDLDKVKYPLVMVQEYGLNIFRIAASLSLGLEQMKNVHVLTQTQVSDVTKNAQNCFDISYKRSDREESESFDFLINAAGFKSGEIDDMLGIKRERLVEFKAAYVTKWEGCDTLWPEVVFHGKRGTPQGMAQFTPYPDGYFQLHGMTNAITLFDDGLVKSSQKSSQPQLDKRFLHKIDKSWKFSDVQERSQRAIEHVARFIPRFERGKVAAKPLYGAQQIPGDDATLRAAEVSFEGENYARCEIVKASSVLSMAETIAAQLVKLGMLEEPAKGMRTFEALQKLTEEKISVYAEQLCKERDYPVSLAHRNIKKEVF